MNKYLLEIGVEEFPAGDVRSMLDQLDLYFNQALEENNLTVKEIKIESTPRRFAVLLLGLDQDQASSKDLVRGPSKALAYDGDEPSKALEGFIKGQGAELEDVIIQDYKGEDYVFVEKEEEKLSIEEILKNQIPGIIRKLNSSKTMKWGEKNLRFARPIRYFLSLYNDEILDFDLEGIRVDRTTKGHRDLGSDQIVVEKIDDYVGLLKDNGVILKREDRKKRIKSESIRLAKESGGELLYTEDLLNELVDINEYPTPVMGSFDEAYLDLPREVIITVMVEHQRYFAIDDGEGNLLPNFITIRNGGTKGLDNVREGNEKVIEPRLSDGEFFYNEDLKQDLEDFVPRLKTAVYHQDLGTIYDKTMRLVSLVDLIGNQLVVGQETIENAKRAAYLSKADLVTNMVDEFPELQGTMGRIYAQASGEKKQVATAIEEQYMPVQAGSSLPQSTAGMILSIADKLDSVVAMYAAGVRVTGSQDPYALRRAALGIINIIVDKSLDLDLEELVKDALYTVLDNQTLVFDYGEVKADILEFFKIRFRTFLIDQGYDYDIVDAVLASGDSNIHQLNDKVKAVSSFLEDNDNFLETITRVANISKDHKSSQVDESLLDQEEEKALYQAGSNLEEIDQLINTGHYEEALDKYSQLSGILNDFLDKVMVMVDDEAVKNNRLSLLKRFYKSIERVFVPGEIVKD